MSRAWPTVIAKIPDSVRNSAGRDQVLAGFWRIWVTPLQDPSAETWLTRPQPPGTEHLVHHRTEPTIATQVKYLTTFAKKVGKERFDADFAKVIKGSDIAPRAPRQRCATAAKRLTKARARKLITALVGHD